MKSTSKTPRSPGRPLSFKADQVLHKAMLQFWKTGYETTSMSDLVVAMGINAPSIYSKFGDKEQLFLKTVDHYLLMGGAEEALAMIANSPSSKEAASNLLMGAAKFFTEKKYPGGCLIASNCTTGSTESIKIRERLNAVRRSTENALKARIELDIQNGILKASTDSEAMAGTISTAIQGFSTLARDGESREKLLKIASFIISNWETN